MSTRANIIITSKSHSETLWFYRHSDGYPDGVRETLSTFMKWVKDKKIRDNVGQSAGWLIMLGAIEYGTIPEFDKEPPTEYSRGYGIISSIKPFMNYNISFKVGAYEPTVGMHGDIEHLYVVDLDTKEVREIEIPNSGDQWEKSAVIQVL